MEDTIVRNAPIILTDFVQRSPRWHGEKLGKPSASEFDCLMPTATKKYSEGWWNYLYRLVAERMLKRSFPKRSYTSRAMQDGIDREAPAREAFEERFNKTVYQVGLVLEPTKRRYCCSPDGYVGAIGSNELVEIKGPTEPTQFEYLLKGLGGEYFAQIQGQMLVTQADRVHFWSWHPDIPPVHIPVGRDDIYIKQMLKRLEEFCDKLDSETERATNIFREWGMLDAG